MDGMGVAFSWAKWKKSRETLKQETYVHVRGGVGMFQAEDAGHRKDGTTEPGATNTRDIHVDLF